MSARRKSSKAKKENAQVTIQKSKTGAPALTSSQRLEAHALALELLVQCQTDYTIKAALRKKWSASITYPVASTILRKAKEALQAEVDKSTPQRRAVMRKRLEGLYRKAMGENKLNVCQQVLKQLCELDSLNEPMKVNVSHTVEFGAGRSVEDLNFYADNGAWPEEMPGAQVVETTGTTTNEDPLAALPPVVMH